MLRLAYRGKGRLDVEEAEPEPLTAGHVRVRIHSAGICTSDVYGYRQVNQRRDVVLDEGDRLVMGHEAVGHVESVAPDVQAPAPGARVAVNPIVGCRACPACAAGRENLCPDRAVYGCLPTRDGAYAETMVVPSVNAVPLHDDAPVEWGALVEPLAVGAHGAGLAEVGPNADVLVVGGGIIGLGAALSAARAAHRVQMLEPQAHRREIAARLGLESAHPDDVLGSGARYDGVVDCVARPETLDGALRALPPGGAVVLVGIWQDAIPFSVAEAVWGEKRIVGSYGYTPADFAGVADWVSRGEVDLSPIIEARVGFDGLIGAFERYADGSHTAVRTLLQPTGSGEAR